MENDTFSINSGSGSKPKLIPHGTLHFAQVRFREMKKSQRTGGSYASLELNLIDGEHEGRKLFTIVMNPFDPANRDEAKRREGKVDGAKMGLVSLTRMLETAGIFAEGNEASYRQFDASPEKFMETFSRIISALDLQKVAIRIKESKGTEGYEDKNEVAEYLSPYRSSGGFKDFCRLVGGEQNIRSSGAARPAQPQQVFQQPQAQPQPQSGNRPAWLNKPSNDQNPF
jgi:hypothetical protein